MMQKRYFHIAAYFPENHETPGYHIITTTDVIKTEMTLQQNGFVNCPVHGDSWALPGSVTVLDGTRKRVVRTINGFALHNMAPEQGQERSNP